MRERCVITDIRPGIKFDEDGVCYPCLNVERPKEVDWKKRREKLKRICDKYKGSDYFYDCIIPVSLGKIFIFRLML